MLASILLYLAIGELVRLTPKVIDPSISYLFSTLAVAVVGIIFVVRRTLVARPAASLALQPEDPVSLNHWRTGYIVTYALCEMLALFGLIQRFLGASLQQSGLYYLSGFILLAFFRPQQPEKSD